MNQLRKYLSIIEQYLIEDTIKLTDMYDYYELNDQSERIYDYLNDEMLSHNFTIKAMPPTDAKKLLTASGDMSVVKAFKNFATKNQKSIVRDKIKNYDTTRVIVLDGNKVIDGNHQVIAAILSNKPLKFIDLSEI